MTIGMLVIFIICCFGALLVGWYIGKATDPRLRK